MAADGSGEVARAFFEAMERGDLDAVAAMIDRDVRWWVLGAGEFDWAGIGRMQAGLVAATEARRFTIVDEISAGNRAVIEAGGDFLFKDGRKLENSFLITFTVVNGKITAVREYLDTAAVRAFTGG